MRFFFQYNNDGDQKARAWVVVVLALAVILGELVVLAVLTTYLMLAVDLI